MTKVKSKICVIYLVESSKEILQIYSLIEILFMEKLIPITVQINILILSNKRVIPLLN